MNMHITPKLREALHALQQAGGRLTRCRGGWHDATHPGAVVTMRTANVLANAGLAAFDSDWIPSLLELTPRGRLAAETLPVRRAAA